MITTKFLFNVEYWMNLAQIFKWTRLVLTISWEWFCSLPMLSCLELTQNNHFTAHKCSALTYSYELEVEISDLLNRIQRKNPHLVAVFLQTIHHLIPSTTLPDASTLVSPMCSTTCSWLCPLTSSEEALINFQRSRSQIITQEI